MEIMQDLLALGPAGILLAGFIFLARQYFVQTDNLIKAENGKADLEKRCATEKLDIHRQAIEREQALIAQHAREREEWHKRWDQESAIREKNYEELAEKTTTILAKITMTKKGG